MLLTIKLAFFVIGVVLFAYGVRADAPGIRWVGIVAFLAAFLLRFVPEGESSSPSSTHDR